MFVPVGLLGVEPFVPKAMAHTVEMTCLPAEIMELFLLDAGVTEFRHQLNVEH